MVKMISPMVDMKRTPEEKTEDYTIPSLPSGPDYPYGLCISLCEDELDKLNIEEVQMGAVVHMHCLAVVTSVSMSSNSNGDSKRVELQITHIAAEDEDDENEEEELEEDRNTPAKRLSKFYK